ELHGARGRGSPHTLSLDAWGIEDAYLSTTGTWRRTSPVARARLRAAMDASREARPPGPAPLVLRQGAPAPAIAGPVELHLEDGAVLRVEPDLPPDLPLGYHEIRPLDSRPARPLIVAPPRCHLPEGLRAWGWAIQLYALRSRQSWGMGDLADLRQLAEWSASTLGAGAIVLNP